MTVSRLAVSTSPRIVPPVIEAVTPAEGVADATVSTSTNALAPTNSPPAIVAEIGFSVVCCESRTATPPLPVVPSPLAAGAAYEPVAVTVPSFTTSVPARISMPSVPETEPPSTASVPSPGKKTPVE